MRSKTQEDVVSFRISNVIREKLNALAEKEGMSMAAYLRHSIVVEYSRQFGTTL